MRDLATLRAFAIQTGPDGGAYLLPFKGRKIRCIASNGMGWDHVSASLTTRCPNWFEMEFVKRTFFEDWEWAMQLHAPPTAHINIHPNVLHLWRSQTQAIPIPPDYMV